MPKSIIRTKSKRASYTEQLLSSPFDHMYRFKKRTPTGCPNKTWWDTLYHLPNQAQNSQSTLIYKKKPFKGSSLSLAFVYVQFVHYIEIIVMILIIFFKMQQLIFLSSLHTNYAYNNSILEQYTHQIRFFLQDVGTTIVGFPVSVKF